MQTHIDLVASYYPLLIDGDADALLALFSGEPVINDPRLGEIRGREGMKGFVEASRDWLTHRQARVEHLAATAGPERIVQESLLHLQQGGDQISLPVAVVGDIMERGFSALRVYHSMWPLIGGHEVRPPILKADHGLVLQGAVAGYQDALARGDAQKIVDRFEPDGYFREPSGGQYLYRGKDTLRPFFEMFFANGGGILLEHCTATDDGVRCAIEYNAVKWGKTELPPQAGVAVYERGASGLLAAARVYDDVTPPMEG